MVSLAWTLASSAAAIALGLANHSLVLVAFGLVGSLDAAGSSTLVLHFRHVVRHEVFSPRHEHIALNVVTTGLVAVGVASTALGVRELALREHGSSVPAGAGLAAASAVALVVLSRRKRDLAYAIPSRALLGDAWLSATGSLLAAITVAGTALTAALDWWWVDPVAAAFVGCGAVAVAAFLRRQPMD